jgi:hypothetical protein
VFLLSNDDFVDEGMGFNQANDPFLRHNFLFEVNGFGMVKAKPRESAVWIDHIIKPAIAPPLNPKELDSLEEDSFYGQSKTRAELLKPKDTKRKSQKRKNDDFIDDLGSEDSYLPGSEDDEDAPRPSKKSRKE